MDPDIVIAPLRDSSFNRAKSNLKWLEAAALSVPCVASNVGHMAQTVRHGVDGVLANDPAAFGCAIDELITNRQTRSRIGKAANRRVRDDFNIDKTVFAYAKALAEAVQLKKDNPRLPNDEWASNTVIIPRQTAEMGPTSINISVEGA
jgi:glycosyltransferase involved in cell wall biosynthesis